MIWAVGSYKVSFIIIVKIHYLTKIFEELLDHNTPIKKLLEVIQPL